MSSFKKSIRSLVLFIKSLPFRNGICFLELATFATKKQKLNRNLRAKTKQKQNTFVLLTTKTIFSQTLRTTSSQQAVFAISVRSKKWRFIYFGDIFTVIRTDDLRLFLFCEVMAEKSSLFPETGLGHFHETWTNAIDLHQNHKTISAVDFI